MSLLYPSGAIKYKGDLLNNLPHGIGTMYFENGNKQLEGTFDNGVFKIGKMYYHNGKLKYEGEADGAKMNGTGKRFRFDGKELYSGVFENDHIKNGIFYNGNSNQAGKEKNERGAINMITNKMVEEAKNIEFINK